MVASRVATLWIVLVVAAIPPPVRGVDDEAAPPRRAPVALGTSDGLAGMIADRPSTRAEGRDPRTPAPKRPASPSSPRPMRDPARKSWKASQPIEDGEVRPAGTQAEAPGPAMVEAPADAAISAASSGDPIDDAILRFEAATARSRKRDHEVDEIRSRLTRARVATESGYDAKGYLQPSSRKVDGQKVHALIGPNGVPVAYLDIPPGIPTARLLARRVGVRGTIRFNESLGARLIKVRDLEPLDEGP